MVRIDFEKILSEDAVFFKYKADPKFLVIWRIIQYLVENTASPTAYVKRLTRITKDLDAFTEVFNAVNANGKISDTLSASFRKTILQSTDMFFIGRIVARLKRDNGDYELTLLDSYFTDPDFQLNDVY
jgi:hypothetical protein